MTDKIRKFSSRKNPSKNELAEFRNYVAQLKKSGKITSKVSARNARPANISGGKTFAEIVNAARETLVPFVPKFKLPKQAPYSLSDLPGLRSTNLADALHEIAENPKKFDDLLDPEDRIAMEIEGTGTLSFYRTLSLMAEEFERYSFLNDSNQKQAAVFRSLKVVRWPANKSKADWLRVRPINKPLYVKQKRENARRRAQNKRSRE